MSEDAGGGVRAAARRALVAAAAVLAVASPAREAWRQAHKEGRDRASLDERDAALVAAVPEDERRLAFFADGGDAHAQMTRRVEAQYALAPRLLVDDDGLPHAVASASSPAAAASLAAAHGMRVVAAFDGGYYLLAKAAR